jgi:DNA polymerase theta
MLRTLLQRKKKAIFILPFVSVVAEKADYLSKMFKSMDICVHGFYANKVPSSTRHRTLLLLV